MEIKPVRVQRSRCKKQISPNGLKVKYCGRQSMYGNPFKLMGDIIYIDAGHRRKTLDKWVFLCIGDIELCVRLYECVLTGELNIMDVEQYDEIIKKIIDIEHWISRFKNIDLKELIGYNLSCFCALDKPCHVDVIFKQLAKIQASKIETNDKWTKLAVTK